MNIMFQVGSWHYDKGGTDLFVKTLSYWLAKKGHKVVVLVHRLKNEKCSNEDIKVGKGIIKVRYTPEQKSGIRFNPFVYGYRLLITSIFVYKLAREEEINCIVVGETELLAMFPLIFLKTKILCRGGALMYETMSKEVLKERGNKLYSRFFIGLIKIYNNLSLKIPDFMIPVNQSEYEFMDKKKRKSAGIITIPHGVEINVFKPKLNLKDKKKIIIGYVGRLAPIKYPELIIDLFKEATLNIDNCEFHWVGPLDPNFKKEYFDDLKKEKNIKNARYLGRIDNKKLPEYLNKFHIFIQAEQQKNVSRSTTEAASCGLPIVALNIGREPYGSFTMNKERFVKQLRNYIEDRKLREKKGREARNIIEKNYSQDVIYGKYLKLFEELR